MKCESATCGCASLGGLEPDLRHSTNFEVRHEFKIILVPWAMVNGLAGEELHWNFGLCIRRNCNPCDSIAEDQLLRTAAGIERQTQYLYLFIPAERY